jgi:hypothetical protein
MTTQELEVRAKVNKEQIHEAIYNVRANVLVLGQLLKENRDMGLWKLEYDSFECFLGDPEISMKRSWAYGLIQIYELYVEKLGIPAERLLRIEPAKLLKVAPVVESDTEGWLTKAEMLSLSDLNIERGRAGGKISSPPSLPARPSPHSCINGCSGDAEKGHFPITRGAGGEEVEDWWIPMCRECHGEYHQDPKEWTWKYRKNWARWFYKYLVRGE